VLKNLNGSQQLPRTDLVLVKIEPGTRKGLIFIIKNLENDRIDHYMSYNQPDALSNFRLQCRWRYDHFKKTKTPVTKKHCNAYIVLRASDDIQLSVSRRETNFITGATEKVTKKLNHLDPRSFLVENYQIIDGNADHICQGQGYNSNHYICTVTRYGITKTLVDIYFLVDEILIFSFVYIQSRRGRCKILLRYRCLPLVSNRDKPIYIPLKAQRYIQ